MKSQMIRLYLLLGWGLLLILGLLGWVLKTPVEVAAYAPPNSGGARPNADFHFWRINEIFSCADGSIQFVEMVTTFDGQHVLNGHELRATSGGQTRSFFFPSNSSTPTGNKSLLIATAGFGSLPNGVTPDFTLTSSLIFTNGAAGSVSLIGADTLSYGAGQLPLDGINSLGQGSVTGVNSPKNFAGQQGSVSCLPNLTLTKTAAASGTVEAGGVLTYTIRAENSGSVAATNALITDTVPLSTNYVAGSASGGGVFNSGVISWANLSINQGATLTRTFQVTVGATITTGDKITNTAYITSAEGVAATGSVVVTGGSDPNNRVYLPVIFKTN